MAGTLNVLVNAFSGDIHSFGQGLSLFGVGALAGWLAEYGGPVTSSIILSGGNSFVNQGFNNGFDNIAIDNILYSIGMSLITTGLSSQLSNMVSPIMEKIPHLTSPILDQMLRQGFWYSVSGFTLETISSLSNGESISNSLEAGLRGFGEGVALGAVSGMGTGLRIAHAEKVNPWTGEKRHGHHSYPKFLGGDVRQPLTNISESRHVELHKDLNTYLDAIRDSYGNGMRPKRGNSGFNIQKNFSQEMRFNTIKNFYDLHQIKYWDARWYLYRNNGILKQWRPW